MWPLLYLDFCFRGWEFSRRLPKAFQSVLTSSAPIPREIKPSTSTCRIYAAAPRIVKQAPTPVVEAPTADADGLTELLDEIQAASPVWSAAIASEAIAGSRSATISRIDAVPRNPKSRQAKHRDNRDQRNRTSRFLAARRPWFGHARLIA